ncbi:hypothetical protein C8R47DRAFT_1194365 [Mycena vitilis]|nr:hypothetical protein C8R47DRAFT_1194365 [Mycena vitilis]
MAPADADTQPADNADDKDAPPQDADAAGEPATETPVKRGRGRPKGSKNKKAVPAAPGDGPSAAPRKRGRPPKEKKDDDDAKDDADDDDGDDEPPKKKRGRPPKAASAADPNAEPKKRGRPPKKAAEKPAADEA